MTVAGGTMIKHPYSMAASLAFLQHLKQQGPDLQSDLNQRTHQLVSDLNSYFLENKIPIHFEHFSSYYLPKFLADKRFEGLFYIYLRLAGLHIYMDYPCFLSAAHSNDDIEFMFNAFKTAATKMVNAGFIDTTQ